MSTSPRFPLKWSHGELRKLEDWDSEDEFGPTLTVIDKLSNQANKNGRVVVLKHMFTLKELKDDPSLLLDLKEDVREECATLGDVTNVVLYDVRVSCLVYSVSQNLGLFLTLKMFP